MKNDSALVLFSGGQDSTICLIWACKNFKKVETIGFEYNQRHLVEMKCRTSIIRKLKENVNYGSIIGKDHIIDLSILSEISKTALTKRADIKILKNGLPNTFIPGRNLIFFTMASAVGYKRNIFNFVGGMCETDFSGYPDCRQSTLESQQLTLSLGLEKKIIIHTPLMNMSKSDSWKLAYDLGKESLINIIIEATHSCYLGDRNILHEWGYGCGLCPACKLRAKGFIDWKKINDNI